MDDNQLRTLEQERQRGHYWRAQLDNPYFQELWTYHEQRILAELKSSSPRDSEGREKAVLLLQMLEAIRKRVVDMAETGKMASITIEQHQSFLDRMKQWGVQRISRDGLPV